MRRSHSLRIRPDASAVRLVGFRAGPLIATVLVLGLATACTKPAAWGEPSSLILIMPGDVWELVEDSTYVALEPTILTTREETKFNVTQVDPGNERLQELLAFRQVIVMGTADDPNVLAAAGQADVGIPEAPVIFTAENVWARGQLVVAVVVEAGKEADMWLDRLGELIELIDERYHAYVLQRMYVSGIDTVTADSLQRRFGLSIRPPTVYDLVIREGPRDTVVIVRNDNPDPGELVRSILITWRPRLLELSEEIALDWRAAIDSVHYNVPQRIEPSGREPRLLEVNGREALEVTGTWIDESSFPAAGPYITRLVQCPDRTVFIDAWLYAPRKPKYEYMIQLRHILNSFTCGDIG
jgi:hypothetical protein